MAAVETPHRVVWTSVFGAGPGGGNPCPVVFGADHWSTEQMQAAAAAFGVETVFVLPPKSEGDVQLRYFVPQHEMEMCVHATVAATVVLGQACALPRSPARVETPLGPIDVEWDAAASSAVVQQFAPVFGPPVTGAAYDRVLAGLRLTGSDIADEVGPVQSVSTARPKLLIPVRDEAVLDAIRPDADRLWAVCDELGVTGGYPFSARATGADVAARQFPNRTGYLEDPATGVAACALAAYLAVQDPHPPAVGWTRWRIAQGRAMGRPSMLIAEAFRGDDGAVSRTRVGGTMRETSAADPFLEDRRGRVQT